MAALQLRVLGDLEVIRGDAVLELPPSRKTRGLLAYLALTDRPLRREQLCELLWEIPDDPRGSLRWSLSKIRKLVDDEDCPRIIANRSTVAFDTSAVGIDVLSLHRTAANAESATAEELQDAARNYRGTFLDGLDLADFNDFQAWCIGERQRAIRSQSRVLEALVARLSHQPEQALEHATALVALAPFEESPRAELIRLLVHLDRQEEARHHFHVGREKLAEMGVQESGALGRALRGPRRVDRSSDALAAFAPRQAALVGREAEIELLGERINNLAASGSARLLLTSGEPGIGKSCLLQVAAAIARKAGARIFRASAFESEKLRPFGVWRDALRRGLPDNNPAHRFLASGEQMSREQVFSSLVEIFRVETSKGPVVVLCDDAQWADESSWSAVHYMLRNHPRQPLLFIVGCRDAELKEHASAQAVIRGLRSDGLIEEIRLQPLSQQQIASLILMKFPHAEAHSLAADCGGNPLLALELARAGVEGKRSLSELVSERLSRLDANAETLLHWAAVLAPRITIGSLENASGLAREVVDEALDKAEQQGFLHPGERGLRFSHELVRSSLYDLISPARRRAMHRHAAELLEVEAGIDLELAADLSHHAQLSGDPFLACKAAVSAGKMCIRFYANDQAMALYRQGMESVAQLNDAQRICLSLELAEVRFNAQPIENWQQEVEHFVQLAEQAIDHGSPSHARLGYQMASYLRWAHGEWQGAKRFSLQAERIARGATDNAQILGMAEAAKCLALLERDLSQADAMAMEARALAQRLAYSCPAIQLALGILRYYEHKFDDAIECLEDARAVSKADGDRLSEFLANEYLAMVELERGDVAAAAQYAGNLAAIGDRMRDGSERPFAHALQAVCNGLLSREECVLEPALSELRAADAKQRLAFLLNRAAIHDLQRGELQSAFAYASEALLLARIMERPSELLHAYITLEYIHRSDSDLALDSVCKEIERLAATGVAGWVKARAQLLLNESN